VHRTYGCVPRAAARAMSHHAAQLLAPVLFDARVRQPLQSFSVRSSVPLVVRTLSSGDNGVRCARRERELKPW
jgi:hypothetical protein